MEAGAEMPEATRGVEAWTTTDVDGAGGAVGVATKDREEEVKAEAVGVGANANVVGGGKESRVVELTALGASPACGGGDTIPCQICLEWD